VRHNRPNGVALLLTNGMAWLQTHAHSSGELPTVDSLSLAAFADLAEGLERALDLAFLGRSRISIHLPSRGRNPLSS